MEKLLHITAEARDRIRKEILPKHNASKNTHKLLQCCNEIIDCDTDDEDNKERIAVYKSESLDDI